MHSFAQPAPWALLGIIVASALGALMMCLLVLAYGLPADSQAEPAGSTRRLLLTRVAHALGAACFAIGAMLAVVVLVRFPRDSAPVEEVQAAGTRVAALRGQVAALELRVERENSQSRDTATRIERGESRASALEARVERSESRVGTAEERVGLAASRLAAAESRAEAAAARLDRVESRLGSTNSKLEQIDRRVGASEVALQRALAVAQPPSERPASGVPVRQVPTGSGSSSTPSASPSSNASIRPVATTPSPATTPPPATTKPAHPEASAPAKSPGPGAGVRSPESAKADQRPVVDKLRDDWQTIKREGAASPEEIKKAFRDLWEKLTR